MSAILMSDIAPHLLPVVTAVIAAAAALGGAGMTRSTQRESARIQLLDVTVQRLSERVEALDGRVRITPRPRFTVFVTIPKDGQGKEGTS